MSRRRRGSRAARWIAGCLLRDGGGVGGGGNDGCDAFSVFGLVLRLVFALLKSLPLLRVWCSCLDCLPLANLMLTGLPNGAGSECLSWGAQCVNGPGPDLTVVGP